MLAFGTRALGAQRRREVVARDLTVHKSEWMEAGTDTQLSPTIFLVEQPPNSHVTAHFHRNNQFQVFVGGGGSIGKSPIGPVLVHYAGAYTAYGPLLAGSEGIQYFTIRPVLEAGANYVPEQKALLMPGPKRHAVSRPIVLRDADALAQASQPAYDDVIPHAADGLGATAVVLPPAGSPDVAWPAAAAGVFVMVLAGSLACEDRVVEAWESIFASTPQELPRLAAGAAGCELVFMFVPAKDPAYR